MKKDRISMLILAFEIVAIVAMHATKQNTSEIAKNPGGQIRTTPVFSATAIPTNNVVFFMPGYSY